MSAFRPLVSPRLILRSFRMRDVEPFHAYRTDPGVARFQGWKPPTRSEAEAFVETQREQTPGALGVGAQIAIELRSTGTMIGDVFLQTPSEEPELARIGFTLATPHQRNGYATEAVTRLLEYVFDDLGRLRVAALTLVENQRSISLLERVGMRREAPHGRSARLAGDGADECAYALRRDEWLRRHGRG